MRHKVHLYCEQFHTYILYSHYQSNGCILRQVMPNCDTLPMYTLVGEVDTDGAIQKAVGVFMGCIDTGILEIRVSARHWRLPSCAVLVVSMM
jgi:hypothetical protein